MTTTTEHPQTGALTGRGIAQAAVLLMIGFVLSRVLGLARNIILAAYFDSALIDTYAAALRPPETLFYVVAGGALGSAFIPTFTAYLAKEDRGEAWRLASAVANLITLILVALSLLAGIFARPLVNMLLAPEWTPDRQALTAQLMQIMMLTPAIFGVSGLLMGILNAHQRFLGPALAPSFYNLGIIGGAVFLSPSMGIYGPAVGSVIGALLHFAVQLPGLGKLHPTYFPVLDLQHPGVREVARLMAPRVLGLAIVQINFWVNTALASGMVEGSVAALYWAWGVFLLPQGVIAQSVANAVFPTFSVQVAKGDSEGLSRTLGQVLRAVLFLSLPATVGLVILRLPVVRLLYERGEFTFQDSQAAAWALLFFGLGLISHSLVEIVTRAFYALHDTRTPVYVGGGAMALNVVLSLILIRFIGTPGSLERGPFAGLALANTLATTLEGIALLILIRPRVGGLDERRLISGLARAGIASLGMGAALWFMLPFIDQIGLLLGTFGAIAVGSMIFWGLAWLAGSEEARLFTGLALRKLRRSS